MKKLKKDSSAGTEVESSTDAQVEQVCQPIAKPDVMRRFLEGQSVLFEEDSLPYTVIVRNKKYVICTRKLNKRRDSDLLWREVERRAYYTFMDAYESLKKSPIYTIVDLDNNIRGTENLIFCMGFGTKKLCEEALKRLSNGESEIRSRNRIPLNIVKVSPNGA
jgi:hypothetical protein